MIPTIARYEYCVNKAMEFILNENLNKFPFEADKIFENHCWSNRKYTDLAKENNMSVSDIIKGYKTKDGSTFFYGTNYVITYNDTHIPGRVYFTKLHEIGHVYLNHFVDFDKSIISKDTMTKDEYKVLENEANCFARNVIAPAIIVQNLGLDTPEKIAQYFGITKSAAKTRYELLYTDYQYINGDNEKRLLDFWGENIYKKKCLNCNYGLNSKGTEYCPICGNKNLIWGDGQMKYDFVKLNELNKATICPTCENEHTNIQGEFCQICGSHIKNLCGYCGEDLSGESRFCNYCGSPSKFNENGYLTDWKEYKNDFETELTLEEFTQINSKFYDDSPF